MNAPNLSVQTIIPDFEHWTVWVKKINMRVMKMNERTVWIVLLMKKSWWWCPAVLMDKIEMRWIGTISLRVHVWKRSEVLTNPDAYLVDLSCQSQHIADGATGAPVHLWLWFCCCSWQFSELSISCCWSLNQMYLHNAVMIIVRSLLLQGYWQIQLTRRSLSPQPPPRLLQWFLILKLPRPPSNG